MKLTDFCILFAALFICLFLGRDLTISRMLAAQVTEAVYDRQMDRITEDALMDIAETGQDDGTLSVRTDQLQEQYERLFSLAFDLADDDCRLRAWEAVTLRQFQQYPYDLSAQELEAIRLDMEAQINRAKRLRQEEAHLSIALPFTSRDDWYQSLEGPQLFGVFDPREPLPGMERAIASGSRIVKLAESFSRTAVGDNF